MYSDLFFLPCLTIAPFAPYSTSRQPHPTTPWLHPAASPTAKFTNITTYHTPQIGYLFTHFCHHFQWPKPVHPFKHCQPDFSAKPFPLLWNHLKKQEYHCVSCVTKPECGIAKMGNNCVNVTTALVGTYMIITKHLHTVYYWMDIQLHSV